VFNIEIVTQSVHIKLLYCSQHEVVIKL